MESNTETNQPNTSEEPVDKMLDVHEDTQETKDMINTNNLAGEKEGLGKQVVNAV